MVSILSRLISRLAYQTGISGNLWAYQKYTVPLLLITGVIFLLFGTRLFRMIFSVVTFIMVLLLSSWLLSPHMSWGSTVTFFAIFGTTLGFLAYFWPWLSACTLCGLIASAFCWLFIPAVWAVICSAALAVLFTKAFPVLSVSVCTAAFGSSLLGSVWQISGWRLGMLFLAGIFIQLLLARGQNDFPRVCPQKMEDWINKKWKKKC